MENRKYIEIIKQIISSSAQEYVNDNILIPQYFKNLFPEIKSKIKKVAEVYGYPEIDETTMLHYYKISVSEYLSVNPIDIMPSSSLTKKEFITWLTKEKKNKITWHYSNRYFQLLEKMGRSERVVKEVEKSSLKILEKVGDPGSDKPFYVKGMVVGSIQSGKTGNFNAVINRAIDCGYGLIIVLSGIMEDLRSQTQQRIESDVIGEGINIESSTKGVKGVGKIHRFGTMGDTSVEQVFSITSCKSDFNKALADADFSLNHKNILVCKKNVSVLRNLIVWLHDYLDLNKDKHNIPLLIVDDEADNASLNNEGAKGREYASKTNGHIRALLDLFDKKTYLGYTATPFANVLQDRNEIPEKNWEVPYRSNGSTQKKVLSQVSNLFPDDFIVLLDTPSNYIGAKQIFETLEPINNKAKEKIPLLETVTDHISNFPSKILKDDENTGIENFNNKDEFDEYGGYLGFGNFQEYKKATRSTGPYDDFPKEIPVSLKESIICFILSIAIRESRKSKMIYSSTYNPNHTMLVHISRFTLWQNKTRDLISKFVSDLQMDLQNDSLSLPGSRYLYFEQIWYKYYANIVESIDEYLPDGYVDKFLSPITFDSLKQYLPEAVLNLEVKAINSVTNDKIEYSQKYPKKIIAIGGNRLSRGFTLEGLTINYFVRSTHYSDTLLQMGRWFGYRPGYLDCCKLFTSRDSIHKFDLTTRAIEELELEFRKMEAKDKTPENFVLRVKKHPGALKITRPSILKNTIDVKWSYQDQLEQTTKFKLDKDKISNIWSIFIDQIVKNFEFKSGTDGFLTCRSDIQGIISILQLENNFDKTTCNGMIKFLELCETEKKLKNWTIAIKTTGTGGILKKETSKLCQDIKLSVRRGPKQNKSKQATDYRRRFLEEKTFCASGKSANIISSGEDLSILLECEQKIAARKNFIREQTLFYKKKDPDWTDEMAFKKAKKTTIPERVYREKMSDQEGLFLIYLFDLHHVFLQKEKEKDKDEELDKMFKKYNFDVNTPLIGYAIGFPPIEPDIGGVYVQGDYDLVMDEKDEGFSEGNLPEDLEEQ